MKPKSRRSRGLETDKTVYNYIKANLRLASPSFKEIAINCGISWEHARRVVSSLIASEYLDVDGLPTDKSFEGENPNV